MREDNKKLKRFFWKTILGWYRYNKRIFPWRNTNNPFHILTAEFLLQQTNAEKVERIYNKMISKYSTPDKLAAAEVEEVKEVIKPLGLLYRAERLINAAEKIHKDYMGKVPESEEELEKLSGVGQYISDAVRCYGFNQKTIPIDTNVIRVFSRFYGLTSDKKRPRTDNKLKRKIRSLYLNKNLKECNLAILDYGAVICKASSPECIQCGLIKNCYFKQK